MDRTIGTRLKESGIFRAEVRNVHRLQEKPGVWTSVFVFVRDTGEGNYIQLPWESRHDEFFYQELPLECTLVAIRERDRSLSIYWTREDWSAVERLYERPLQTES